MIDIHCHILPGIDDGAEDIASSVAMARLAAESGTTSVVATPHLRSDFPRVKVDEMAGRCAELNAALRCEGVALEVIPGGEVSVAWALEADGAELRSASYAQRGVYLLVETPAIGGPNLPSLLSQVAARGFRVVLAHPERSSEFQELPDRINVLVERGAIASDAHRGRNLRPIAALKDARHALGTTEGEATASRLTDLVPSTIISGGKLPATLSEDTNDRVRRLFDAQRQPWVRSITRG
jgi:hypothetical protein